MMDHYLVRLASEINLKSPFVRKQFLSRLSHNIRAAFAKNGLKGKIFNQGRRLYLEMEESGEAKQTLQVLGKIFGLHSLSPVEYRIPSVPEEIIEHAFQHYHHQVQGKTFAVRVNRGDIQGFTSHALACAIGAKLYPGAKKVDLKNPEFELFIDVRSSGTYFFSETQKGVGGLPLGCEGKALSLLSGGFDSSLASWMMMKRGMSLDYVFFNLGALEIESQIYAMAKRLFDNWGYGDNSKIHFVDFAKLATFMRENLRDRYLQVLLKRQMFKLAAALTPLVRAQGIVTGEAIGQVSSQTPQNLAVIESGIDVPIFRPLICFDKDDIIAQSRKIGMADLAEKIPEYCNLTTHEPATNANLAAVLKEEAKISPEFILEALSSRKIVKLGYDAFAVKDKDFLTDKIDDDMQFIDCREKKYFDYWHYPGAIHCEYSRFQTDAPPLNHDKRYLIYCAFGEQSAEIAQRLRKEGYLAQGYLGGSSQLRALAPV